MQPIPEKMLTLESLLSGPSCHAIEQLCKKSHNENLLGSSKVGNMRHKKVQLLKKRVRLTDTRSRRKENPGERGDCGMHTNALETVLAGLDHWQGFETVCTSYASSRKVTLRPDVAQLHLGEKAQTLLLGMFNLRRLEVMLVPRQQFRKFS
jgi:hypothetical protein